MTACRCGNTARHGADLCGRCETTALAEERQTELMDAVRNAAMDLPEGPLSRFGDAVVAWMEERGGDACEAQIKGHRRQPGSGARLWGWTRGG